MADFVSDYWHWYIVIPTLVGILALFPLCMLNRGDKKKGDPETMGHTWDEDLQEYNNPLPGWWLNMFYITIIFGLVYLALYPGLGTFKGYLDWSSESEYKQEIAAADAVYGPLYKQYAAENLKALAQNDAALRTGERLFANYCSVCHGSDARGALGFPNLRDSDWLWGGEPEQIKASIMNGRNGVMPPWKAVLGGDQGVSAVAEYVISLSGRKHDPVLAATGKDKFQICAGCHQADGTGNPALGAPNLTDPTWLYGGSKKAIVASVGGGRSGKMPPHKDFLGEDRVHLLAAYVYSLSHGR